MSARIYTEGESVRVIAGELDGDRGTVVMVPGPDHPGGRDRVRVLMTSGSAAGNPIWFDAAELAPADAAFAPGDRFRIADRGDAYDGTTGVVRSTFTTPDGREHAHVTHDDGSVTCWPTVRMEPLDEREPVRHLGEERELIVPEVPEVSDEALHYVLGDDPARSAQLDRLAGASEAAGTVGALDVWRRVREAGLDPAVFDLLPAWAESVSVETPIGPEDAVLWARAGVWERHGVEVRVEAYVTASLKVHGPYVTVWVEGAEFDGDQALEVAEAITDAARTLRTIGETSRHGDGVA